MSSLLPDTEAKLQVHNVFTYATPSSASSRITGETAEVAGLSNDPTKARCGDIFLVSR